MYDVAAILAFMHVNSEFGVNFTWCVGPSMTPTINEHGDAILIDMWSYEVMDEEYKVGDVVVARCPTDRNKTVCKRIAATEGQTIMITQRHISPYPKSVTIPKDHVWLAGDNAANSTDSRNYGAVPVGLLQGRAFTKLSSEFPFFKPIAPLKDNIVTNVTITHALQEKALEEVDMSKLSPYEMVLLKRAQQDRETAKDKDKDKESSRSDKEENNGKKQ